MQVDLHEANKKLQAGAAKAGADTIQERKQLEDQKRLLDDQRRQTEERAKSVDQKARTVEEKERTLQTQEQELRKRKVKMDQLEQQLQKVIYIEHDLHSFELFRHVTIYHRNLSIITSSSNWLPVRVKRSLSTSEFLTSKWLLLFKLTVRFNYACEQSGGAPDKRLTEMQRALEIAEKEMEKAKEESGRSAAETERLLQLVQMTQEEQNTKEKQIRDLQE